ncbi:F-box and associated interaction domains-containing protein isoform 1 [Theobroma cacao]|uniref:F-box and associated interaction domains-containing protein isoform 1 n=2 Tax=Theobroma cacao TaxID=3641 RepID=A0A061FRJ5_THECC|nr:F-box and associated interaction domains-containing protein isoform 1 [Theobroma cacao]
MLMPISNHELPEIMVIDILLRLPVKSLMRFRCVCKSWCSSFQTSEFITNHRNKNLNLLLMLHDEVPYFSLLSTEAKIKEYGEPEVEFNLKVKENIHMLDFDQLTVSGPCNGLLCVHDNYSIILWNPSTREVKVLPESTISRPPATDDTYFGFVGFGFDRNSNDYKVLRCVNNCVLEEDGFAVLEFIYQIDLYSLRTDSWREIAHPDVFVYNPYLFNAYINGIYYWEATGDDGDLILSFDMVEEVFSTLSLPNFGMSKAECSWCIASFKEALATIVHPRIGMEKCYDIWILNGYSWTKQLTIGPILGVEMPLGFWKNGELFLESENHKLVMFDPCTGQLRDFGIYMSQDSTQQLVVYAESIVSIRGSLEYEANITREVQVQKSTLRRPLIIRMLASTITWGWLGCLKRIFLWMAKRGYEIAQSNAAWILDKYGEHNMWMDESGLCTDAERHQRAHSLSWQASEQESKT